MKDTINTQIPRTLLNRVRQGDIRAIYELDRHVSVNEPFYRDAKVFPCSLCISTAVLHRLEKMYDVVHNTVRSTTRFFVFRKREGGYAVFCNFHDGANGPGDFFKVDVANVLTTMAYLQHNTEWATILNMEHDVLDDVSDWSIVLNI